MENKYILSYLKDYYQNPQAERILDYFKVDFDNYLYAYGCQFGVYDNLEVNRQYMYEKRGSSKKSIKYILKTALKNLYGFVHHEAYLFLSKRINQSDSFNNAESFKKVLFINHVSLKLREEFVKKNIKVYCVEEFNNKKNPDIKIIFDWYESLNKLSFSERLELNRYDCLDGFIKVIQKKFNDFDGLFVGDDEYFICKLFIDAFKEMNIPTYNWSHGIEASVGMPLRTDFVLVWGPDMKKTLIKDGKKEESILVSGNINYFSAENIRNFRNSFDDVLVLTSVTIGHIRHTWDYESFAQWDRSLLLTYIYSVEKVLKSLGVKHARLRPHPINNKLWVEKFIDTGFYSIDYQPLDKSLESATLAIGPTSSTFAESLRKGVMYIVYEPGDGVKNIAGVTLVPPFDDSDSDLRVAFSEKQLKELLTSHYTCSSKVLDKYIIPFDMDSFIHTLGKKE